MTGAEADPASHAETADSLSLAFLVLLERSHRSSRRCSCSTRCSAQARRIAGLVGGSEDLHRQIAARAAATSRPAAPVRVVPATARELARRFFAAVEQGDTEGLVRLLADDVVMYGDGGGKARLATPSTAPLGSPGSSSA